MTQAARKPGRPIGSRSKASKPHAGSFNDRMMSLSVGSHVYLEADAEGYSQLQRSVSLRCRRPKAMDGMEFTSAVYTAVSAKSVGDVRYLVRVERLK